MFVIKCLLFSKPFSSSVPPKNCSHCFFLQRTTLSAAIGYENGSVLLISMTGDKSFECTVHNFPVLGISSNPTYFASFDSDSNVLVWTVDDGQCNCTQIQVRNRIYKVKEEIMYIGSYVAV